MWAGFKWVLDWIGRLQLISLLIGGGVSGTLAKVLEAPSWAIFGLSLIGSCIGLLAINIRQNYQAEKRAGRPLQLFDVLGRPYEARREKAALLRYIYPVFIIGALVIMILVGGGVYLYYKPSDQMTARVEPQKPLAPEETVKPSEPSPPVPEKVEPAPSVKPIPPKVKPPNTKKDVPKAKEVIPNEPDKSIETAHIEVTPIPPKEKIASVLIKKFQVPSPGIGRSPEVFIPEWLNRINTVGNDNSKPHDLLAVLQERIQRLPVGDNPMKRYVDEATATMLCLADAGYIRITETTIRNRHLGEQFNNKEFEFVPERLDEFKAGL